jgi:peroxiredoxin Q/BCP
MRYRGRLFPRSFPMARRNRFLAAVLTLAAAFAAPAGAELEVGAKAPAFTAPAYLAGEPFTFKLADALKRGPVVVYFFPAVHTPGCNIEAKLFSDAIGDFQAAGASVVGISAGKLDEMAAFSKETEHCGGKFPVAADAGAKIAAKYDALLAAKPELSSRTSYVIAPDGTIVLAYSEMKPHGHVKETLAAVRSMKKK